MRTRLLILTAWALSAFSLHAADAADATETANTFSAAYLADYLKDHSNPEKLIQKSPLLTPEFKVAYAQTLAKAWKADPELGLGYDPIISGQDAPEEGYRVKSLKVESDGARAILASTNPGFTDKIRVWLVQRNDKWLINGINDIVGK